MMEVPRKPTFPDYIIKKFISKVEQQVQDNIIPVSTGRYTEQKLISTLQAIPKPVLVDYDDPIFFQVAEKQGVRQQQACLYCHHQFDNKTKPIMCRFCRKWTCEDCLCHRKRLHPRDNNPNGIRFDICYECDSKYLCLQMNHPYVQSRMLIETAIVQVSKQLQQVQSQLDVQQRKVQSIRAQPKRKLNMKNSILKKQQLDIKKNLKKLAWDVQSQKDKRDKLRNKLIEVKNNLKKQKQLKKQQLVRKQIQRKQTLQRQKEQREKIEEEQKRLQQKRIQEEAERQWLRIKRLQQEQKQRQRLAEQQRIQKQLQRERQQFQKQKRFQQEKRLQMQRKKQLQLRKQRQISQQRKRKAQIQRQKEIQRQKQIQIQKQKQIKRQKQIQQEMKKKKLEKQQQQKKRKQIQKQQLQRKKLQIQQQKQKQQQQKRRIQREKIQQLQLQRKRQQQRKREQQKKRLEQKRKQEERRLQLQRKRQQEEQEKRRMQIQQQQQRLKRQRQIQDQQKQKIRRQQQVEFTFDPQKHNKQQQNTSILSEPENNISQQTAGSENSNLKSYVYNQFKNYFTQDINQNNSRLSIDQSAQNQMETGHDQVTQWEKQEIFSKFKKTLQESENKTLENEQLVNVKAELLRSAAKKEKHWERSLDQAPQQIIVITPSQKCKCMIF